jgi:hypothetical protein
MCKNMHACQLRSRLVKCGVVPPLARLVGNAPHSLRCAADGCSNSGSAGAKSTRVLVDKAWRGATSGKAGGQQTR